MFIEITKFEVEIKGITWFVWGALSTVYNEINSAICNDWASIGDTAGICWVSKHEIGINLTQTDINLKKSIIHEITHAYVQSCCIGSTDLGMRNFEELFCGIMEEHLEDIRDQSNRLFKSLKAERRRIIKEAKRG